MLNAAILANRRLATAAPNMHGGLETVAVDWAGAFYAAYSHLLPAMETRLEVEAHFVLWASNADFCGPLHTTPRQFRQVLYAMARDLQVCRVAKDGSMEWAYKK